jgi:hypothetical protein
MFMVTIKLSICQFEGGRQLHTHGPRYHHHYLGYLPHHPPIFWSNCTECFYHLCAFGPISGNIPVNSRRQQQQPPSVNLRADDNYTHTAQDTITTTSAIFPITHPYFGLIVQSVFTTFAHLDQFLGIYRSTVDDNNNNHQSQQYKTRRGEHHHHHHPYVDLLVQSV